MVSEKLSNLEVMTKANVYWDGKVTSRTFFTADGEKHTLGIITAGTYTFGGEVRRSPGIRDPGQLRV